MAHTMEWALQHSVSGAFLGKRGWITNADHAIRFTTAQACNINTPPDAEWVMIERKAA